MPVKSTVETLSPTRVRLEIEVPFAELEPSLRKAYREIGSQINIPGFRKGKVPTAVLDQRVGRETILQEAVQDAIPEQLMAAVREHEVHSLGRPEVEITDFADGKPLKFTAEVDVRPEIALPDESSITLTVDDVAVADEEIDNQLESLRLRFATLKNTEAPVRTGDFVQIDLAATVDGEEVPGGTTHNLSHEVGSNVLLPGLDDVLVGMAAGEERSFTTSLVAGEFAGRDADVSVTVRTVRERELPPLDDDFAGLASEYDTLGELRDDLAGRIKRAKQVQRLYDTRDKALNALLAAADVPAPEGIVRDEVESRKAAMAEQLGSIGASMAEFLESEHKTEEEFDADITKAATEGVKIQLLMDAYAERDGIEVSNDEFSHEIVHRAQRAGMAPQQYYDELVRSGAAGAVYGDVRRGKALTKIMERFSLKDSSGAAFDYAELRADEHATHDHGDAEGDE
jgi:trigger factor